ncbi:MAG: tRNA (N6-isopentenyl adenosine(37)-C2)-methylthiotransferase MiaB [Bacteroidia bacterium]
MAQLHAKVWATCTTPAPYPKAQEGTQGKAYIETYGCQMNFADTEIVARILAQAQYGFTPRVEEADLILLNTCAIRDHAELKIWSRLKELQPLKKQRPHLLIGLLGCMAERLRESLLQAGLVDLVVGPDAYRSLPQLIATAEEGGKAINVLLSREETYADIAPLRLHPHKVSAYLSIMRGCNNMCSFCIVPFTRGRERSRSWQTILAEIQMLADEGYQEVILLGQNVDSYNDQGVSFAQLLHKAAQAAPHMRIRFATSHPKDMTDEVLYTMAQHDNLCKYIHLPVQSGSDAVLQRMNRGYSRAWYLQRIEKIRTILPGCAISTDILTGFCGETHQDHQDTLRLMEEVQFDSAYMFMYSERPGTLAARRYADDVPPEVKHQRLQEIIALQQKHSYQSNLRELGKKHTVLIEGISKRSPYDLIGRTDTYKSVILKNAYPTYQPGNWVEVCIQEVTSATLIGIL